MFGWWPPATTETVFGYPARTPAIKRRILGHNAAELHGRDVAEQEEALGRLDAAGLGGGPPGPVSRRDVLSVWRREHPWF